MSDFVSFINDVYGQRLFEQYVKSNGIKDYLYFWFAIEGFKIRFDGIAARSDDINFQNDFLNSARAIYNRYIKQNPKSLISQWFSESTREQINDKIEKKRFDSKIFEDAKPEFVTNIQKEVYPTFLKSDIYQKYADSLKIAYPESKAMKLSLNKSNPYHSSVTNYHTTSKQESECRYDSNEIASTRLDDQKLFEQYKQVTQSKVEEGKVKDDKVKDDKVKDDKVKDDKVEEAKAADSTLQVLYSTGARSHLPSKPEDDPIKVKMFMEKLEKIYKEYREYKDKEILKVIEKFEPNGEPNSSLRKLINKRDIIPDSQSILDQHCIRVFSSNLHTKGPNSPKNETLNSFRRILKQNGNQKENKNAVKHIKRDQYKNPYFTNHSSSKASSITLMYQYSSDDYPFSIKIDHTPITLKQFKKTILKKPINLSGQRLRYFFKKKDLIENMYIFEELTDNNELVPLCDDRVFSKIEIVPI